MTRILTLAALLAALAACGNDEPASTTAGTSNAPTAAAPSSAAPSSPAADTTALPSAAATTDDDEITYDPIDVSKLDNAWWQQYSAGS
ncbi:MAG: hypothetical protein WD928_06240 [Gammaproteobacteria bacterium]